MRYLLMDYINEAGWPELTRAEQTRWMGAYKAYMEAMTKAGVLKTSNGLQPTSSATTVRVANDKTQVLDGPYADSKEQLGFTSSTCPISMPPSRGQPVPRPRCTVSSKCVRSETAPTIR
jgi:hypothetical protein